MKSEPFQMKDFRQDGYNILAYFNKIYIEKSFL